MTDRQGPALRAWSGVFPGRLTAFQYYSDHYAAPPLATPYTIQMKSDREAILETSTNGMLNLLYVRGYWWRQTLNAYLAGRSFYDPSLDPDDLLADYGRRYHGPSAGPQMARYYRRLAKAPSLSVRLWRMSRETDRRMLQQLTDRHIRPSQKAVQTDGPVFRHRMQKATRWHGLAEAALKASRELEIARKRARTGRPRVGEHLEKATRSYESAQALAAKIAELDQGIVDPSFEMRYRSRFLQLSGEVKALAKLNAAPKASPVASPER